MEVRSEPPRWWVVDLAEILLQLWRRRVAVGVVTGVAALLALAMAYRISVLPPGLSHRSVESGAAETKILIDYPRSSVADLNRDFGPLQARAQVLSQLMTTAPVVDRIANIAKVPASAIEATSDNATLNVPSSEIEPSADRRANDIAGEGRHYRVTFRAEPEQPTITVFAQGPTAADAMKLANAAASGAADWVRNTQLRQLVPDNRRTQLTQLGTATGGTVNSGASRILAVLVFVVVLGLGCLLVLLVGNTIPAVRQRRIVERTAQPMSTGAANGNGAGNAATRKRATRAARMAAAKSQAQAQGQPRTGRGA
jgi:hypothetical protein